MDSTDLVETIAICSICKINGPLEEIQEHFLREHMNDGEDKSSCPIAKESSKQPDVLPELRPESTEAHSSYTETDITRWTAPDVLLLIRLVEENYTKFDTCLKKNVWMLIAGRLASMTNKKYTHEQIDNKWKGLKKTYKKIKDHNNMTGNNANAKWEFFNAMDAVLCKRPEVTPVAVCDTSSGLKINKAKDMDPTEPTQDMETVETAGPSSFMKARKRAASDVQKRHDEKMRRYDRFLDIFEKSVKQKENQED